MGGVAPRLIAPVSEGDESTTHASSPRTGDSHWKSSEPTPAVEHRVDDGPEDGRRGGDAPEDLTDKQASQSHHHHVPTNAFLSIGLQTSIAIALHKLPEGFITYATNHANSKLGFAVFMALFIHNITEGFAMALPLYLAIGSRAKAMLWSSLLGGVSQPLGAGVAALWFALAGRGDMAPGEGVYGAMFAITGNYLLFFPIFLLLVLFLLAFFVHRLPERKDNVLTASFHMLGNCYELAGIMTSVALQLFSESLDLSHNRTICTSFAFLGMALLGSSFALTAD